MKNVIRQIIIFLLISVKSILFTSAFLYFIFIFSTQKLNIKYWTDDEVVAFITLSILLSMLTITIYVWTKIKSKIT